jgi:HPt (histidine-containing phosphotransfer) domain-containing protein
MRDHVAKPVDLEQLVACLRRHVGPIAPRPAPPAAVLPLLERDAALQRLGGRVALYERLAKSFAVDAPAELLTLKRHLQQQARDDAMRVLHTLRGLAGAVGASALAGLAGRQEQALREGGDWSAVDLDALQGLLDASVAALAAATPAARPPTPGTGGTDPLSALRQLRQLLVERNMRSVAVCEQLAADHAEALGAELGTLSAAVAKLDFAKALKVCDLMLDRLNPR